jgi:hypothetical protein
MTEIQLPNGPHELLRYFEGVDHAYPDPHWKNGAIMCRRWIQLAESQAIHQEQIDSFVRRLGEEEHSGAGWLDLGLQFRHWARLRGFKA